MFLKQELVSFELIVAGTSCSAFGGGIISVTTFNWDVESVTPSVLAFSWFISSLNTTTSGRRRRKKTTTPSATNSCLVKVSLFCIMIKTMRSPARASEMYRR
ncbi:hypothetical protein PHAVU_001G180450 [Phaseolus vulgaris]